MRDNVRKFLEEANSVRLTADEKKSGLAGLKALVEQKDFAEMEKEAKAFFALVKDVTLSKKERNSIWLEIQAFNEAKAVSSLSVSRHHSHMHDKKTDLSRHHQKHSLSGEEKESLRERLQHFMNHHAVEQHAPVVVEQQGIGLWLSLFIQGVLPRTMALACVFLLIGSGAAYAAEGSVPGDFLYTYKVKVENIRGHLAFGERQKAQWEGTRALRRLEEVEKLTADNKLTQDTWVRLHGSFIDHVVEAEHHIDSVAKKGDMEGARRLSADLEVFLRAHHSVMESIGHERRDNSEIQLVIEKVQKGILKNTTEKYVPEKTTAQTERRKLDAQSKIMQALRAVETGRKNVPAQTGEESDDEALNKADAMIMEANAQFDIGSFEEAAALAREAVRFAEEAKILKKLPVKLPKKVTDIIESVTSSQSRVASSSSAASVAPTSSSAPSQQESSSSTSVIQIPLPGVEIDLNLKDIEVTVPGL